MNQLGIANRESGFRRWRACWNCRARSAISSACRSSTRCRPARWPRSAGRSCCSWVWPRGGVAAAPTTRIHAAAADLRRRRAWVLTLADKLRRLFDYDFPNVRDLRTSPVWAAGELLQFGGNFNNYVTSKGLQKQEGLIFRHLLRMILLLAEFTQLSPPDVAEADWRGELEDISARIAECCRRVDPTSTEKVLEEAANEAARRKRGRSWEPEVGVTPLADF